MKTTVAHTMRAFMLCLLSFSLTAFSQENCKIQLAAEIKPCTCINNGEIKFNLTKSTSCQLDTGNIRYSLHSPANSIHNENSVSPIFSNLPPGDYTGIVKALHHTGELGEGANIVLYDTLQLTVNSSYSPPSFGLLENEYTRISPFGKVRSLPCLSTGIIQLHIHGGSFPYNIKVYQYDGSQYQLYKEVLFDTTQHHGTLTNKRDYVDYYDIDSLPAGKYRFVLTDGCGYTPQHLETTLLQTPNLNETTTISKEASNREPSLENNVYFSDLIWPQALNYFAIHADYYAERQYNGIENYWEYRWIDPSVNGSVPDTSSWQPIDFGTLYHRITAASKYCELWGKALFLQVRDVTCHQIITYTYHLNKPLQKFKKTEEYRSISGTGLIHSDSCGLIQTTGNKNFYTYSFSPLDEGQQLFTVNNSEGRNIRYIITDAHTNYTILEGIAATNGHSSFSYRADFTFDSPYHGRNAKIKIYDALSCPLYEDSFTISVQENVTHDRPKLNISESNVQNSYCQHSTVDLVLTNSIYFSDHDTISILESPSDLSNCSLYYEESQDRWIRCDSNTNISTSGNKNQLTIAHVAVGGYALIQYKHGCFTTEYNHNLYNNSESLKFFVKPVPAVFKVEPTCNGTRIIPLSGSYKEKIYTVSNELIHTDLIAYFKIYGNPHSPQSLTGTCMVGDTINIFLEGDIRIVQSITTSESSKFACTELTTIVNCGKKTLEYDYFYSYCCQIGDTVSTVRTRAKGGVPPYLYVISDKEGKVLDSNRVGDFFNLPLPHHDTVRLQVFDQCGSNFVYQGQVIEQRLLKKVWFDDGTSSKTLYDSNFCQFFSIPLDNMDYYWNGPCGYASNEQNPLFFIPPDSNMSGKYYLSLRDSICGIIKDSLSLKVLAKNHIPELLWINDSICSGKAYHRYGFDISSSPSNTEIMYFDTLISPLNDSTFLRLTLLPVFRSTHIDSIVTSNENYPFHSLILKDTGLYEIKLQTHCDCDSTVYVHLMFTKYLPCPDVTDFDGNHYPTARISNYCWTTENLKSIHYSDGRPITSIYQYCSPEYPDAPHNTEIFGYLYDWFAAIDTGIHPTPDTNGNIQGICPSGWLLPTDEDFAQLGIFTARQLKSPSYWIDEPGTNESGFSSLPAGFYDAVRQRYSNLLGEARYWTVQRQDIRPFSFQVFMDCAALSSCFGVCDGYSIRCIKKNE
ncbi:MAG: fibrobacter succinogenes major paralogous domain-containing protein [Bacteroidales bacterium]|nr:fibrobacter succinogenes major paralogous domain-containing protein [Bacteroidales bacterium]